MSTTTCPKLEKCPIFLKNIFHNELVGKTYKHLFCQSEDNNHFNCKRYLFSEKFKKSAPDNVLPNTTLSLEEIAKRLEK